MTTVDPQTIVVTKKLAGGAKNLLDDLLTLDAKTSAEMLRGINEGYLDADGAVELAEKLRIEKPRVQRTFYRYFTEVNVYSIAVSAYDEDQATREAQRIHEMNVAYNEVHYGQRSRFNDTNGGPHRVFGDVTAERPTTEAYNAALPAPHAWELERDATWRAQQGHTRDAERQANRTLQTRLRHESIIDSETRQRRRNIF